MMDCELKKLKKMKKLTKHIKFLVNMYKEECFKYDLIYLIL